MIGTVLENRYTIERQLGVGGMAEVYLAYDSECGRNVAIKLIKKEYCADPQYVRRFEREAKAVTTLDSPNIVHAYGCGVVDGRSYIVLEYVEGMTLKDYLEKRGKLSPRAAVHIACRVLSALECAHNAGYVHRDVKPQNVLISNDKTIKLTDFGIVKDTASMTMTFNGKSVVGSVHYIAPEQVTGDPVSPQSDLYSVGIMLYEMLIGEPPFTGDTPVQVAYKHVNELIVPPMYADESISPALSDVIVKATAKKISARYSSAEEMKRDLVRALREPEERFAYMEPEELMDEPGGDQEENKPRAKLWHFILPAALMVALVLGMFVVWYVAMFRDAGKNELSKVPDLLDKTSEQASEVLHNRELEIRIAGTMSDPEYEEGHVCKQSPDAGTSCKKGTVVDVWLSSGAPTLSMRNLVGMTLEEAEKALGEVDLTIDSISYEAGDAPDGTIIWQSIPEGTEIFPGEETVSVIISGYQGVTLVPMPNLTRVTTLGGIDQILDVYGVVTRKFRFTDTKGSSSGALVAAQTPNAGLPFLPAETVVEIWLYKDSAMTTRAEVGFDLIVDQDGLAVEVVVDSPYGDFVLYENVLTHSDTPKHIEFIAGYFEEGEQTLIVYANGREAMRFTAVFVKR